MDTTYLMTIKEHIEVLPGVRRLVLSGQTGALPGQFAQVAVNSTHDPLLRRPLSVHDCTGDETVLLYRVSGRGTGILSEKQSGTVIDLLGPLGNGFPVTDAPDAVLVAGGMGIAPLHFLARMLVDKGKKVRLYIGAKTSEELYIPASLKELAFSLNIATDDGSTGYHGFVTGLLASDLTDGKTVVYTCGPLPMMREVTRLARVHDHEAYASLEAGMACGVGACQGCVVAVRGEPGYKRVCADGPVFRGEEVFFSETGP